MPPAAMTLQVPAPPAPPASPAPPSVIGSGSGTQVAQTSVPQAISPEQAAFLRTRRDALGRQLESAQERRDEVADQLRNENTQAAERPGLEERLKVLDQRLIDIEKEIAVNGEQLANAPAVQRESGTGAPAGRGRESFRVNGNMATVLGFLLLMPFAFQMSRRWFSPDRAASRRDLAEQAAMRDRMDKMESAIDAVAIEVERIGEGQRFLTQAMMGGSLPTGAPAFEGVPVRPQENVERR